VESLDDVIDAMIADRVIHRHRRKWLAAIAVLMILAVVIWFTGGWSRKTGRLVDTVQAPVTLQAGRFEYGITTAKLIRTPKTRYSAAKTRLEVSIEVKNIDDELRQSYFMPGGFLRLVPGQGKDPIASNGATCHGKLNYLFVYGLPPQSCFAKFDVPAGFSAKEVEIGVVRERFESDDALFGASEKPYWHDEEAVAVVKVPTTTVTEAR
jgi:hypothetical protein